MIGKLYNAEYIEEHFPWFVQKYKDKNGEPVKAFYGIPVNEASKNFLWDCLHVIEGPFYIYNSSMDKYERCYKIKELAYNGTLIPKEFFECIENNSVTIINTHEEETVSVKEEKKSHKVVIRKVTNDHDYFCYLAKKYGYNWSKPAPLPCADKKLKFNQKTLINIEDVKWWDINEKTPPIGVTINLCIKKTPNTSNCSPYRTFLAKYVGCNHEFEDKYVFTIGKDKERFSFSQDEFRWTVCTGSYPDF